MTKGIAIAKENGQPAIAPRAKKTVANNVRLLFRRDGSSNAYESAIMFEIMANDEGKNAIKGGKVKYRKN